MIGNITHLFKKKNEDYYEPYKMQTAFNNNYVEYMGNGNDDLSVAQYLHETRLYLTNFIKKHQKLKEWKIQIMMNVNFISFKNSDNKFTLYLVSDKVKIMIEYNTDIIINDPFRTLLTNTS